jgi:hypothetical protein
MKLHCDNILISFTEVLQTLGRATPGAQNKHELINFLILSEIKNLGSISNIEVKGESLSLQSSGENSPEELCEQLKKIKEIAVKEVLG